ncbi:hypothetical protein BR93DRAFT_237785 [Coniochaeta sp. PMI_546]|nr:hypothetical protein BR93DRAFT_237785 [Coniochaeta sp. PMI_546]
MFPSQTMPDGFATSILGGRLLKVSAISWKASAVPCRAQSRPQGPSPAAMPSFEHGRMLPRRQSQPRHPRAHLMERMLPLDMPTRLPPRCHSPADTPMSIVPRRRTVSSSFPYPASLDPLRVTPRHHSFCTSQSQRRRQTIAAPQDHHYLCSPVHSFCTRQSQHAIEESGRRGRDPVSMSPTQPWQDATSCNPFP